MGTVTRGLWSGYWAQMIEDTKGCKPEVEASQSDKRLQSYGWLKICYLKTQICIFQAQKSLKFSGGGPPDPRTPLPNSLPAEGPQFDLRSTHAGTSCDPNNAFP